MAEEVLVGEQLTPDMIKSGELVVVALDKGDVVVKGAYWLLLPEQREWRLVIASPEVRFGGPMAMYRKIREILGRLPAGAPVVGTKDISAVDEKDPLFLRLRSAISTGPGVGGIRFSRNVVKGQLIEDAYVYRVS